VRCPASLVASRCPSQSKRTEAGLRSFDVPLVGWPARHARPGIKLAEEARDKPSGGASFPSCEQLLDLPASSFHLVNVMWIACLLFIER